MIKAENLEVVFKRGLFKKKIRALNGFSIHVREGDVFGLIGPNGAGKSTALYCFLGLIKPDKGDVRLFGEPPEPGSSLFNQIAYVPEEPHYHMYLTVREAVRYYADLYNDRIPESKVDEALERLGLADARNMKLQKCSKGMKQKAGLAVCLLRDPKLVLLDEPTRGLDPVTVKEFRNIVLEMNGRGVTFVINSHVLSEVEQLCNEVAIINQGQVAVQDNLDRMLARDLGRYSVELEKPEEIPDYIKVIRENETILQGEVTTNDINEFLSFIQSGQLKLYECSLKRATLEAAFFDTLDKEKKNA